MTEMIKRVEIAIRRSLEEQTGTKYVGGSFELARAAIEAMREVDQHALWTFVIGPHYRHVSNDPHLESRGLTIEEGWHALIDAALTDARGS